MPLSLTAQTRLNSQGVLALPTGGPWWVGWGCWGVRGSGGGNVLHATTSTLPLPSKLGVDGWGGHMADRTSTDLLSDPGT